MGDGCQSLKKLQAGESTSKNNLGEAGVEMATRLQPQNLQQLSEVHFENFFYVKENEVIFQSCMHQERHQIVRMQGLGPPVYLCT